MHASTYYFLKSEAFTLPYQVFGSGPDLLLAFHGFGRSSEDYRAYEELLGAQYTILAFDFFYHGPHALDPEIKLPPLNAAALADMIENLLWERKKVHCSMIGYSQGGRIVMGLIHRLPHRLQEVFILAPDGLQPNKIRNWVSRTRSGRGIAKLFVKNAALLQGTIRMLARFGFISEKIKQFYLHQSASEKDRFRIYHTWLCLRNYETHPHLMDHYCRTRNIRTAFIMGKYDTIIPVKLAERFLQTMQHKAVLHILDCGHKLLQSRSSIARIILDKNHEKPVERNG